MCYELNNAKVGDKQSKKLIQVIKVVYVKFPL